jgi:hypothetical protein
LNPQKILKSQRYYKNFDLRPNLLEKSLEPLFLLKKDNGANFKKHNQIILRFFFVKTQIY